MSSSKRFALNLLKWHREKNTREMPWKGEKDPYKIWLSEIILQQTRVEQGWDYYNRFINKYPDILQLANAPEAEVFKLWEGLGYYSRCRNLIATARHIAFERKGKFPDTHQDILSLKGVGPYTAAAISSFAYNLPHAVVDGNVFRVLARVFGIRLSTDSTEGKKYFTQLADDLLDRRQPGQYNQALMDFGAVVCKPVSPKCGECPFSRSCIARREDLTEGLPIRAPKAALRHRWFHFLVLRYKGKYLLHQRPDGDIWPRLFEFPLVETHEALEPDQVLKSKTASQFLKKGAYRVDEVTPEMTQVLSHQKINACFLEISLLRTLPAPSGYEWVGEDDFQNKAFPRLIVRYLTDKRS